MDDLPPLCTHSKRELRSRYLLGLSLVGPTHNCQTFLLLHQLSFLTSSCVRSLGSFTDILVAATAWCLKILYVTFGDNISVTSNYE